MNVEGNMIPDSGSYIAESLASKTFGKGADKLEAILRADAGRESLESQMLVYGWGLVVIYCLMCNKGNFEIYTRINREPVEINKERHARG